MPEIRDKLRVICHSLRMKTWDSLDPFALADLHSRIRKLPSAEAISVMADNDLEGLRKRLDRLLFDIDRRDNPRSQDRATRYRADTHLPPRRKPLVANQVICDNYEESMTYHEGMHEGAMICNTCMSLYWSPQKLSKTWYQIVKSGQQDSLAPQIDVRGLIKSYFESKGCRLVMFGRYGMWRSDRITLDFVVDHPTNIPQADWVKIYYGLHDFLYPHIPCSMASSYPVRSPSGSNLSRLQIGVISHPAMKHFFNRENGESPDGLTP